MSTFFKIIQYFYVLPFFKTHITIYKFFVIIIILLVYSTTLILGIMSFRLKYRTVKLFWPIRFLRISLPIVSYFFYGHIFMILTSVFYCRKEILYESPYMQCMEGLWIYTLKPASIIAIIFQIIIGFFTNSLYYKQFFEKDGSDLLKRIDTFPDVVLMCTKTSVILLFILDHERESEHWPMLIFLIFITGLNMYATFCYRTRENRIIRKLNKTFSIITFLSYLNLFIGKIFINFQFNGLIYLYISSVIVSLIYIHFYQKDEFQIINVNFQTLYDAEDILNYIMAYFSIITNLNHKRNSYYLFHSLMTKFEENCYNPECPLKKYLIYLSKGIEYKYLLVEYCDKLFQNGLSKFIDDINLKYHYALFLILEMNNKKKASILLNSLKYKLISFKANYDFYRCQQLIDKHNFQMQKKNYIIFKYRSNVINLKNLISKVTLLQYEFLSFIYGSKTKRDDNFKQIYKLGSKILNLNEEIDEIYNELIIEKTNNIEIIDLYSEFIEKILEDEDKLKKCQEMKKIIFDSNFHLYEKDFTNFDMRFLINKDIYSYILISANHKTLGIIKDCSISLINLFGYEKKELIGKHINILIPVIFHNKHDEILRKVSETHKLRFFENSYKREVYTPEFIEKVVYGLSKAKFLIPLKLFIYLINTEENELVYVVEIQRKVPLINSIINNKINCCVLTDENFLIQSFTPNSMNYLHLKDNHISNHNIINNIKELHDDYALDINETHLSKDMGIKESSIIVHKKYKNLFNMTSVRRTIQADLLNKKLNKKWKITWLINKTKKRALKTEGRRSSSYNISFNHRNEEEIEIKLNMEIKKVLLEDELVGYYFFFSKITKGEKDSNNINESRNSVIIPKNKNLFKSTHIRSQKKVIRGSKFYESNNLIQTQIHEGPICFNKEKMNNNNHNKFRRKSFGKSEKFINNYYDIGFGFLGPDFVCDSPCNFNFDINTLSFYYSTKKDNLQKLNDMLKRDADTKNKISQFQYNSIKNRHKIFSLSQIKRHESTEIEEYTSSYLSDSYLNSKSCSNSESKSEDSSEQGNFLLSQKKSLYKGQLLTEIKKKENEKYTGSQMDKNSPYKKNNQPEESSDFINFYQVNMTNIHFLEFDFNKEIFIENKNFKKISQVENVLTNFDKLYKSDDKYTSILLGIKKDETDKKLEEMQIEEKKIKILNEEKILEKKIKTSISNEKDEAPIIRLKIYSILYLIIMMILLMICYIYFINNYTKIKKILTLFKDTIKIKYCNRMSVFFVGESTLVEFNADKIVGGLFNNFPGKNKTLYIQLLREKIKEAFIESELCLEEILATKISFSENTTNILNKTLLDTHYIMNNGELVSIYADIFTTLMKYNGAFYNLAFSPLTLEQNHTDILNFLHNSFNDYIRGINLLISIYFNELKDLSKSIYSYWIISLIIFFLIYVAIYILIIHYYVIGNNKRNSYLEVFYELNENVLKILIKNCENLFKKLKKSELKRNIEDESYNETLDKQTYYTFKQNQTKRNSIIFSTNSEIVNQMKFQQKLPKHIKRFMKFFGICLIITFCYFIFNAVYSIYLIKDAIYVSEYLNANQKFQTLMIDLFVAYRQYVFDDSIYIYNMMPFVYLNTTLYQSYSTITNDTAFIRNYNKKYLSKGEINELLTKNFCEYNYTDRYANLKQCQEELSFLLNYDFTIIANNFLETLRKAKFVMRYLLSTGKIVGGLNDYNQDLWLQDERIPQIGKNNTGNYRFRLDLYNDKTVHSYLDLIFVNILLPYIDINRKYVIPFISLDGSDYFLRLTTVFYVLIVFAVFCIYLLLEIKFLNKHIYRTKNLLRLIPLNILMSLNNIKSLLDLN